MSTLPTTSARFRPRPAPAARPSPPAAPGYRLGFFLFLLVNAALFVRPADIVPELQGWEIYQYLILACCAFSFPAVLANLSPSKLESRPADLCVLMLLPAIAFSLLPHRNWGELYEGCFAFFKIIVYYLLLVSLVTTPKRLRIYLACIAAFAAVTALLSILDHHQFVQLPRTAARDAHGKLTIDPNRMYGPGIFSDPNDVCVLIVTALMIVIGQLADRRLGFRRWLWLAAVAVFGYGFYLTQSRGGLLALFAGLGTLIYLRFGWRNAILLGLFLFPGILAFLGSRQSTLSVHAGTGQERIELWNAGLDMVRHNPIFGVGWKHYPDHAGQDAHNSFMHAFGELGLFGGMLLLGAYWVSLWGLYRLSLPARGPRGESVPCVIVDADLAQLYPYLAGAVAAYATGMMSLTLNALDATYAMLGVTALFLGLARTRPERPPPRFALTLPLKFLGLAVLYLALMFLFVRLTFRP